MRRWLLQLSEITAEILSSIFAVFGTQIKVSKEVTATRDITHGPFTETPPMCCA